MTTRVDPSGTESILSRLGEVSRSTALAEMAGGIAHDLNQPLGAIATFSQAGMRLLDRPVPMIARALEVFKHINEEALGAGERLQRIRRMFDPCDLVRTRCHIEELIIELMPALEILSNRCHGRIEFNPGASPALNVDRGKIQHVFLALVRNGFEAASGGATPLVQIVVDTDRDGVKASVMDNGPGVPAEAKGRLFKPFFTTKPRCAGLDLASSHSIVEAHGGTMGFENLDGRGCRFWFRLPAPAG